MSRTWLRALLSVAVSAGLSLVLLRQVDVAELGRLLAETDRPLLWVFAALSLCGLLTRAVRYKLLLGSAVGFGTMLLVTATRNFLVDLFPARIGSLSYVYLLNRRLGVAIAPVAASFVLPFVYDLVAMSALIAVAFVVELGRLERAAALGLLIALLAVASAAALLLLGPLCRYAGEWLTRTSRLAAAGERVLAIAAEIEARRSKRVALPLLGLSLLIRGIKFSSYWVLLLAVVHGRGMGPGELPFWRVFLGVTAAEISAALPVQGIAGFGTYEAAWTLGFTHLGLDRSTAILTGFATHLLSQSLEYSIGVVALATVLMRSRGAAHGG